LDDGRRRPEVVKALVVLNKLNDLTGSETYCLGLVKALVGSGWDVDVFTLRSTERMRERVAALGAGVHTYPSFPPERPDRVVTMHPLATFLALRRVPEDVPTMAVVHGITSDEAPVRPARIDRFVAVSPLVADTLTARDGIWPTDVVVIPNGIDLEVFDAPPLPAAPDGVRVLWASTYIPLRRSALAALLAAVERLDRVTLTMVGDHLPGDLASSNGDVRIVPKTEDVAALISDSDVVAGLGPGRILLEALAMNRAALCLNVEGKAEYLGEKNVARLERYLDEWGGELEALLDPETVFRHQNKRRLVAERFDERTNLARLERELRDLQKREQTPARYRARGAGRGYFLAREYAALRLLSGRR
jgi:glycosyltransferase involved in cell wall biosynthesis